MLLAIALVALSRKVTDDKAKRKEAKQRLLKLGHGSEHDKFAVTSDDSKDYRPADVISRNPDGYEYHYCRRMEEQSFESHRSSTQDLPSPRSPAASSLTAATRSSRDLPDSTSEDFETGTWSSGSTVLRTELNSKGAVRVYTSGSDLRSGFPYYPQLFDIRIRPEQWERFTTQVAESIKFSFEDNAQMVAAAAVTALMGAVVTSIMVGRTVNRSLQEQKVKAGLRGMSAGGLGDVLQQWNETEFRMLGLFAHLELSKSAMKRKEQRSQSVRKPSLLYSKREDRERKQRERKFCLVVTRLNEEGLPADALHELAEYACSVEAHSNAKCEISELPGDIKEHPIELPAEDSWQRAKKDDYGPPSGYAELENTIDHSDGMLTPIDKNLYFPETPDENLRPAPLALRLNKETS